MYCQIIYCQNVKSLMRGSETTSSSNFIMKYTLQRSDKDEISTFHDFFMNLHGGGSSYSFTVSLVRELDF